MTKEMTAETPAVTKYTKAQLLGSERYRNRRDLLGALLKDGEAYTIEDADALLANYMKGKVR